MISILPLFICSVLLSRLIIIGVMGWIGLFWIFLFVQRNQMVIFWFCYIIHNSWLLEQLVLLKHHFLGVVLRQLLVVTNEVIVQYSAIINLFALSFLVAVLENGRWVLFIDVFLSVDSTLHEVLFFIMEHVMVLIIAHDGRL